MRFQKRPRSSSAAERINHDSLLDSIGDPLIGTGLHSSHLEKGLTGLGENDGHRVRDGGAQVANWKS